MIDDKIEEERSEAFRNKATASLTLKETNYGRWEKHSSSKAFW